MIRFALQAVWNLDEGVESTNKREAANVYSGSGEKNKNCGSRGEGDRFKRFFRKEKFQF